MNRLFLCVGAAKTGTTWLYSILQHNPGLWFTPEKELNYFFTRYGWFDRLTPEIRARRVERVMAKTNEQDFTPTEAAARAAWCKLYQNGALDDAWYRSLFAEMPDGRYAADFSPSTSLIPTGWDRIASFAPDLRIVYMLRDPQERLWSHAKFHAQFTDVFGTFRDMSLSKMERFVERSDLLVDGKYGTNLRRMLSHVPREQILLVDNGRVRTDPIGVLREIEAFVGLPETPVSRARAEKPVNTSQDLTMPAGFGDLWRDMFREELEILLQHDAPFAQSWAERHATLPTRRRGLIAQLIGR